MEKIGIFPAKERTDGHDKSHGPDEEDLQLNCSFVMRL